ncbi:MAG: iron uptake protein [Pseudomonadota bacterium]
MRAALHLSRAGAALLGGYLFTWGFTALGIAGLVGAGADFHDAETGVSLLAFLVFIALVLWAYAAASLLRVWAVLAGGGALMTAAAWLLQRALLT